VSFVLRLGQIHKRFGRTVALDGAGIDVRSGTVHALLGENGAGKTTLMRVAFGVMRPDSGRIEWHGRDATFPTPAAAMAAGIGMVHQHFTLVPAMTVAENAALGMRGRFTPGRAADRTLAVARAAGIRVDPDVRARDLSVAGQQRAEIVKALVRDASLLILDEPTAVLAPNEAAELLDWMRRFAGAGHSVILITHKLREALRVADDITVLRRGRTAMSAPAADISELELVRAMVGERPPEVSERLDTSHPTSHEATAILESVSVRADAEHRALRDVSLTIRRGEMIGVAGVEGSGHRELLRILAGRVLPTSGRVRLPAQVAFIPEDRQRDALAMTLPLYQNVALRGLNARGGIIRWPSIVVETDRVMREFDVRADSARARADSLSGGNQQKLVLGRELADSPQLVVVENPTRGLDVRSSIAVLTHLRDARQRGGSVVIHSSDLDEMLPLADRMFVVFAGMVRETPVDRDEVSRLMLGAA
jgi:general nucleoside transport system ATP-binding protein